MYATGYGDLIKEIKMVKWQESHYFVSNNKRHYVIFISNYIIKIIINTSDRGWIDIARTILDKKLY